MEFKDFNDKVVKELEQKKELDNTDNKSGIYAIYIENYDYKCMKYEECIIPIYVGQSKNIYQRILCSTSFFHNTPSNPMIFNH